MGIGRVWSPVWWLGVAICGLGAAGLILWAYNRSVLPLSAVAFTVAFPVLGALIVAHQPRNRIGWIFCAIGFLGAFWLFTTQYAIYALAPGRGSLPGAAAAAWCSTWIWALPAWLNGTLCLLLFPDGRLPSRRWRPIPWLAVTGLCLFVGALSVTPWEGRANIAVPLQVDVTATGMLAVVRPLFSLAIAATPSQLQGELSYPIDNPLGLHGAESALATVTAVGAVLILTSFVANVAAPVLRFRHARGVQRQQLKWVAYAITLVALIHLVISWFTGFAAVGQAANVWLFPIVVAFAILRYHMYDIDFVINRTLVYGLLTAILGLVYAAAVLVLGQVFGGVGGDPPSWAVASVTLGVAAVFQPARRHIQEAVDRYFNRRKYDAAKTIDVFSTRLHQHIDLDTLTAELLAVVNQTVEPTRASLWLRSPEDRVRT